MPARDRTGSGTLGGDQWDLALALHHRDLELATHRTHVLLEDIDGDVPRLLDRSDSWLRDAHPTGEITLRVASFLAQRRQSCGEAQLVLDLGNPGRGTGSLENLLHPLLRTHRALPRFPLPRLALDAFCLASARATRA